MGLRYTPVRYLFLDEVGGYPGDADGEGDPVDLAIQRKATFRGRRKSYMVSTLTLKGRSRVEAAFERSGQLYNHVPWPASAPCAQERTVFIRRMKPLPVKPPLQIWRCPRGTAPARTPRSTCWPVSSATRQRSVSARSTGSPQQHPNSWSFSTP